MAKKTPVEGHSNLVRDEGSGAIININKTNAQIARDARKRNLNNLQRLDNLENDISEIKDILKQLFKKK